VERAGEALGLSEAAPAAAELMLPPEVETCVEVVALVPAAVEFLLVEGTPKAVELLASTMEAGTVLAVPFPPVIVKKVEKIGFAGFPLGINRMAYGVLGDNDTSGWKVKAWATLGFETPPNL